MICRELRPRIADDKSYEGRYLRAYGFWKVKNMNSFSTIFEYLYRDSSNYKVWGELRLSGSASSNDEAKIRSCLESEELFVAEQVGIPVLYKELWLLSNGPTSDDHAYHEFVALRPATSAEDLSVPLGGSLSQLLEIFEKAKSHWNCALSANV